MKHPRTLLLTLGVAHATAMCLGAQEPEVVSGEVTCGDCVITLDTVVTIGGLEGPGLHVVTILSHVAVDLSSRFLIGEARLAEFSIFDSTGKSLRTLGRRGEGPGEYQSIRHIGVGPRYIHIFDDELGRVLLTHEYAVVRTDRFPGTITSAAVMRDDKAVFAAEVPTPESVGHKLHVLRTSGELVSYGYDGRVHPSRLTIWTTQRSAVAGRNDTVWVLPDEVSRNRLVRWDLVPEPGIGRVFDRRVAEFDADPSSMNNAAMLDDRGLWIIWHTRDPRWTRTQRPGGEMPTEPPRRRADGWLDLVDPATGLTLARYHQDGVFLGFAAGSSYVVAYHETDAGVPFLHILEPRLSRDSGARKP